MAKNETPKDPGTLDHGARHVTFPNGQHSAFPTGIGARQRPDSIPVHNEFANFNSGAPAPQSQSDSAQAGGLSLNISSKHNGGQSDEY